MTSSRSGSALDVDRSVAIERHRADPAVGRDVLVLLADRLLEDVYLELARLVGELLGGHELALEGVQAVEQSDGEAARRAEPRVRRHVGEAVQLEAALEARSSRSAVAKMRCLISVDRVDDLALGVRQPDGVVEATATQTKTNLSTAAATTNPPCSRE